MFLSLFIALCFTVSAAAETEPVIIVSSNTAKKGEEASILLSISNNPGIMAITVSVTYDPDSLEYISYAGGILSDYTVADHPEKGYIRFVCCESGDISENGVLVTFNFKVKETAGSGLHKIDIDYSKGDFCNWDEELIMPEIISGGITVEDEKCGHKYSEWETVIAASCETIGKMQRTCSACGITEQKDISATGHSFNDFWTVDSPATNSQKGQMSRHCTVCGVKTDIKEFSSEQVKEYDLPKKQGEAVSPNEFTGEIKNEGSSSISLEESIASNTDSIPSQSDGGNNIFLIIIFLIIIILGSAVVFILCSKRKKEVEEND